MGIGNNELPVQVKYTGAEAEIKGKYQLVWRGLIISG